MNDEVLNMAAEMQGMEREELAQLLAERLSGMWFMDDVREFTSFQIIRQLHELGIHVDREKLAGLVSRYSSSLDLYEDLLADADSELEEQDVDFAMLSIAVLWERWFPEVANAEMLEDSMQLGYRHLERGGALDPESVAPCVAEWEKTWGMVKELANRFDLHTIYEFDEAFPIMQIVYNWHQDFQMALEDADRLSVPNMGVERFKLEFGKTFSDA